MLQQVVVVEKCSQLLTIYQSVHFTYFSIDQIVRFFQMSYAPNIIQFLVILQTENHIFYNCNNSLFAAIFKFFLTSLNFLIQQSRVVN